MHLFSGVVAVGVFMSGGLATAWATMTWSYTMGDHRFGTHYHFGTPSIQQIFDYFTLHMETLAQYHCLRS